MLLECKLGKYNEGDSYRYIVYLLLDESIEIRRQSNSIKGIYHILKTNKSLWKFDEATVGIYEDLDSYPKIESATEEEVKDLYSLLRREL